MAINKKLIHFKTYQAFNTELEAGNILETSIVWIKDTQQIYTHGQFYNCKDDSAITILMTGYAEAAGDTAILPTDTLAVAMGKLQKQVNDNNGLSNTALSQLKESLGLGDNYAFEPTSGQLAGMSVTEAIDWLVTNSGSGTDWSSQIGTNTYDGANYISKETNLTDAAMQLDTEIKSTNDNLAILNAASIKGVKLAGASGSLVPQTGVVTIPDATTSSNGLMPAADKQKVDGILTDGDGSMFLADDGTYKPVSVEGVDDAVVEYNRNTGHNTTTSLSNVATNKRLVIATISSNQSFTTANSPGDGKELHIIVKNSSGSDRTVSMPTTSTYVNMSGDSLTVPANGYAEINVVFDNSYRYIRFAAQS